MAFPVQVHQPDQARSQKRPFQSTPAPPVQPARAGVSARGPRELVTDSHAPQSGTGAAAHPLNSVERSSW